MNGDGFDDILIGAYNNLADGNNAGAVYIVFGSGSAPGTIDLGEVAQGIGGVKILGENGLDQFGRSVSAAGDVNGDGIDDILVGAPSGDDGGVSAGSAYLIFGTHDWLLT